MHLEHLFETLHMHFGFFEMAQKTLLKLPVSRLLGHFRQRLHELLLGIIDVLKLMHEQIVHGLDLLGEESHRESFLGSGTRLHGPFIAGTPDMFDC